MGNSCSTYWLAYFFRSGFTLLSYPWFFPDSYDWLVNGLSYTEVPIAFEISHRAMFFPLLSSALYSIGLEDFSVYFGTASYILGAILLFFGLRLLSTEVIAGISTVSYAFSYTVLSQSAYVGSDVAANALLTGGALFFLAFLKHKKTLLLYPCGLCFGLGIHAQYIGAIFFPLTLLFFVFQGKEQVLSLLRAKHFYGALCLGALSLALLFLPRFLKHGIWYTEKVSHLSLVDFYDGGLAFYLHSFPATFSWPLSVFFLIGLLAALREPSRLLPLYFLGWILVVGGFFALLYTWTDNRFLIYISTPVFFFSAKGFLYFVALVKNKYLSTFAALLTLLALHSPSTPNPFDISVALTPWRAAEYHEATGWQIKKQLAIPYLWQHLQEANERRDYFANDDVDFHYASEPLAELMQELQSLPRESLQGVYYYEPLSPEEHYFVKNRNILYLRSRVITLRTIEEVREVFSQKKDFLLVLPKRLLKAPQWPQDQALQSIFQKGNYVALKPKAPLASP